MANDQKGSFFGEDRFTFKDHLRESRIFLRRAIVAFLVMLFLLGLLMLRLFKLQVLDHDHYTTRSRENRVKLVPLPPGRGLIYDRNGVQLAQNLPAFNLEVTPAQVPELAAGIEAMKSLISISNTDLKRFWRLKQQYRRFEKVPLRLRLTEEEVARFAVNRHRFPGFDVEASMVREYPLASHTAHVVGYVARISEQELQEIDTSNYSGTTHIGKNGIEKYYEDALHGRVGWQEVEVNAQGRLLRVLESQPPTSGRDLLLFLDVELQQEAAAALGDYNGAVVAIDPNTGGVLAMVSKPSFDPNPFVEGISVEDYAALQSAEDKPLYNRVLRGQYPPGSTVKPFMALAGLDAGVISAAQHKYCPGYYQLPGQEHKYRDWRKGGHGSVNMQEAIIQSCDVYFYDLAKNLGIDGVHGFLTKFGFGRRSGVDVSGELPGLLPSPEWKLRHRKSAWYPGETLITGIGQGYFLATPLQLASATATLAARGKHIEPRVVRAVHEPGPDGELKLTASKITSIGPIATNHWERVIDAMVGVVESERGTAKRIRTSAYRIAGKTGTAQVFSVGQDEKYDEDRIDFKMRDHALFVAFAPVDAPEIAVAVLVEHGGHGGAVAAPIARRVMDKYLSQGH